MSDAEAALITDELYRGVHTGHTWAIRSLLQDRAEMQALLRRCQGWICNGMDPELEADLKAAIGEGP